MTKEQLVETVLRRYESIKDLQNLDNFYDYEKDFSSIWKQLGNEIFEQSIGEVPADHRKKNSKHDAGGCKDEQSA